MSDHPLTEQYRALLERIARYPVTDPAARAALEAELAQRRQAGESPPPDDPAD